MQIELINNQDRVRFDTWFVEKASRYVSGKFDTGKERILNIIFVSDREIKKLNKNYRNVDSPTDVLSFSYLDEDADNRPPEGHPFVIGEIYIPRDCTGKFQSAGRRLGP